MQALLVVERSNQMRLGSGGSASVYRGTFKQQPVAVKAMLCKQLTRDDLIRKCSEIIVANELKGHPNIVEHKGFSVSPHIHLVMQECDGSVHQLIHGEPPQPLSTVQRRQLALDVANSVMHVHSKGLVHRYQFCRCTYLQGC